MHEFLKKKYNTHYRKHKFVEKIVIHKKVPTSELIFLGHIEGFGHYNNPSGIRRIGSALIQTIWSSLALWLLAWILHYKTVVDSDQAVVGVIAIISVVFAGCLLNERRSLYEKWNYLANLFNIALDCKSFDNQYLLKTGCLAHDCLIMQMWGHKSFIAQFNETLLLAVILEHDFDDVEIDKEIESIKKDGLCFHRAEFLLGNLIHSSSPVSENHKERWSYSPKGSSGFSVAHEG